MPNRLSSHSGLKLGCLTTNTASARTARVKRRPFHSLNFAPLPNTAVLATEPTLCIRYAYDTGQIEPLSGAKDGRWSGQDFVDALKEVLPDLDPVLAKRQALLRRLYRRALSRKTIRLQAPEPVETNAVPAAVAKSIKSVAVLDTQIVAARCPIPRAINLNCIDCSIAPQGPISISFQPRIYQLPAALASHPLIWKMRSHRPSKAFLLRYD